MLWADNGPYSVQDAGPAQGIALAVNASGVVAGTTAGDPRLAFLTRSGSGAQLLPGLPESVNEDAVAFAVHAEGWAVGSSTVNFSQLPVTFQSGAAVRLSPGVSMGEARAVNASGAIAGWIADNGFKAVVWDGDAVAVVPGTIYAQAFAINDAGVLTGTYFNEADVTLRAFRWSSDSAAVMLPSLGGATSEGNGINDDGDVVGDSLRVADEIAVLWPAGGGLVELGTFGGPASSARDINNHRQIVGYALDADLHPHAFISQAGGTLVDLNTLLPAGSGWVLLSANAINDAGQIAGEGLFNGEPRAFLLTPPVAGDTTPPVISSVATTPDRIWPPRHQMVDISVVVQATDDSGETPACEVTGVTSSEPDNGDGDGDTFSDTQIVAADAVRVRAERSGPTGSRVYTVAVQCADGSGNTSTGAGLVVIGDGAATTAKAKAKKR
jgi:probable HAF family extracellular repeat protein